MLVKIYPCSLPDWIKNAPCILIVNGERDNAWRRSQDDYNSIETDLAIVMDQPCTCRGMGNASEPA